MAEPGRGRHRGARAGVAVMLAPAAAVLGLCALLAGRVPVHWTSAVLAAALYSLAATLLLGLARALARGRAKEMALAAASLALAAAGAEAALRLLRPYDSLCAFRWVASRRYHHANPPARRLLSGYVDGSPVVVETNEDGFRTRHSREGFRRHGLRVAVLGDSFVFGSGVDAEAAFPARLERHLRARPQSADAAVLNAGVISYSPFLERRLFDDVVRQYRPTVVVLFLDVTDVGDDAIYARKAGGPSGDFALEGEARLACYGALYQHLRPLLDWLAAHAYYPAYLVRSALGRPPRPRANYYADPVLFRGQTENRYFIYRHPLEQTEPYLRETLGHVQAVAAAARRDGAGFTAVVFPRYHHWSRRECPDNWERGAYGDDEPHEYDYFRFFAREAPAAGFPLLDLLPAFQATREFPLVFRHDPHWNAAGHEFVAARLLQHLLAQGLVP